MANTEKVFVDLNEEIVFILERIRQSLAPKVVLVVPQSANLTSSLISLKLLTRQISKINKLVVVATDDEYGRHQIHKADLVVVKDPGDITPDIWMEAKKKKEEYIDNLKRIKRELLERRQTKEDKNYELVEDKEENTIAGEKVTSIESDEDDKKTEKQISSYKKQRIPPRLISVGHVKFFAAGDINQDKETLAELLPEQEEVIVKNEQPDKAEISPKKKALASSAQKLDSKEKSNKPGNLEPNNTEVTENNGKDEDDKDDQEESRFKRRGSLAGRNLAHAQASPLKRANPEQIYRPSQKSGPSKTTEVVSKVKSFVSDKNNRKFIIGGIIASLILFVFTSVSGTSATLTVNVKNDNISVTEEITADPSVQGISVEQFTIPAILRNTTDDVGETVNTTGEGTTGERARGQVDIYNRLNETVTLEEGTQLTIEGSNLKYEITTAVSIPATGAKRVVDIPIRAVSHGENYNADPDKTFAVQGYSNGDVNAVNYVPIVGGTTVETRVVSQDDYDSAKDILVKRLEATSEITLDELAGEDEIFFPETINVDITEESVSKNVGEEADKFDISLTADISGLFVKRQDVEDIIRQIAQSRQQIEGESEIDIVTPTIEDIIFEDGVAKFRVYTDASAKASITEEALSSNLSGKSIGEAEETLSSNPDIDSYTLETGPWYIPGFLRKIPSEGSFDVRIISK